MLTPAVSNHGKRPADAVEFCVVADAAYMRRAPLAATAAQLCEMRRPPVIAAEFDDTPDASSGFFMRLRLHRCKPPCGHFSGYMGKQTGRPAPRQFVTVDFHLDHPGSSYLVEWGRYLSRLPKRWRVRHETWLALFPGHALAIRHNGC